MSNSRISDQQIVHALSIIEVPDEVLRRVDLTGIINVVDNASRDVQQNTANLEQARNELREGWWIANWWNKREEKVEDLQFSLQKSIGNLTDKTAQLLIFNTAISRELSKQQETLLDQQKQLKQQTLELEKQNSDIFDQQKILERQQEDINAANQGLLEAKGITAEQAKKLINCVIRVESAESKMVESNGRLVEELSEKIRDMSMEVYVNLSQLSARLTEEFSGLANRVGVQIDDFRQESKSVYTKTAQDMAAIAQEIRAKVSENEIKSQELIHEKVVSINSSIQMVKDELSSSVEESHASIDRSIDLVSTRQYAESLRLEAKFGTDISKIRDDFGRRFKMYLIAFILLSFVSLITAGVQILGCFRH